jgi:hypothetical protein
MGSEEDIRPDPFGPSGRKSNAGCFYVIPVLFVLSLVCAIVAATMKYHH